MLPARSKRYVGVDGAAPRLRLVTPWQMMLIALIMLGLLAVIFPRKALIEKLYDADSLDDLTLSYINNLYRTDPQNADLAILLTRAQAEHMDGASIETLVGRIAREGDPRQRAESRLLLIAHKERRIDANASDSAQLKREAQVLVEAARADTMPLRLVGAFAAAAFRLDMPLAGAEFMKQLGDKDTARVLEDFARDALGAGRHALAGEYFLLARRQSTHRDDARRLFKEGISAYLAASRFRQAMRAADQHLGDLANDAPTLRFLIQSALASGDPQRAARYAQALVFSPDTASGQ